MKILLTLFLIFVSQLFSLTLQDSINYTIENDPFIADQKHNFQIAQKDFTIANSEYFPRVDLISSVGKEKSKNSSTDYIRKSFDIYQNRVSVSQNIFDGFGTMNNIEYQQMRIQSEKAKYTELVNDSVFNVLKSYVDVLRRKKLLNIAQKSIDVHSRMAKNIAKKYDAGFITLSQSKKIAARLSLANSNYIIDKNNYLDAVFVFEKLLGKYVSPELLSEPDIELRVPGSLQEAIETALRENPTLEVGRYNISSAAASYRSSKKDFFPKVNLSFEQSWNKNLSAIEGHDRKNKATVDISYNLFSGGASLAKKRKSAIAYHQEGKRLVQLQRQTLKELELAWASFKMLKRQLEHLRVYKKHSEDTLGLYEKEFDLGRRSLLDLLDAENDLNSAHSKIVNTEYDFLISKARILDAIGRLYSELGVTPDGDLSATSSDYSIGEFPTSEQIVTDEEIEAIRAEFFAQSDISEEDESLELLGTNFAIKTDEESSLSEQKELSETAQEELYEMKVQELIREDDIEQIYVDKTEGVLQSIKGEWKFENKENRRANPPKVAISNRVKEKAIEKSLNSPSKIDENNLLYFKPKSSKLTDESMGRVDAIVKTLKNSSSTIEVRAHTDYIGMRDSNLFMSRLRAIRTKALLIREGISSKRIRTFGYGEANPISTNSTAIGRAKNRRVELIEIKNGKKTPIEPIALNTPTLLEIEFDAKSSLYRHNSAINTMKKVLESVDTIEDKIFNIAVYAQTEGNSRYNLWLSQRRANSLRALFETCGIPISSIVATGVNKEEILIKGEIEAKIEKNRRVILTIIKIKESK